MKLTGKCKEEFEKWYLKYIKSNSEKLISNTDVNYFSLLTDSMQYGVYEDFFRSVKKLKSISEARTAAIEKENEIHNAYLESF